MVKLEELFFCYSIQTHKKKGKKKTCPMALNRCVIKKAPLSTACSAVSTEVEECPDFVDYFFLKKKDLYPSC